MVPRACCALLLALLATALAEDSPKKACSSSLKGDYQFEACGAFCKEAKKSNHCKFCKCRSCTFCSGTAAPTSSDAAPPALSPRRWGPPPPRWPKKGGKKAGKTDGGVGGAGKDQCQSNLKGDLPYMTCASFCKSAKATNHCKFCKCRSCRYCTKEGKPAEGVEDAPPPTPADATIAQPAAGADVGGGVPQRGVPIDRVASTGASHARILHGVGVVLLLVLVALGVVAFTSQGDATVGTWRHTLQTHLSKMGLASHGAEGSRLNLTRDEDTSDLDAAFRAVDKLEAEAIGGRKT